jgi:hypothetical protein
MFIAISSAGAFRSDDAGATWRPINQGLRSEHIPDPTAEVGHCVHRIAMHHSRPGVLFMQKHWDVMRSDDAGLSWREVSGNLPSDFGFPIGVHAHEPETIYVVPIKSDSEHYQPDGKLRVSAAARALMSRSKGLPQSDCYVNVLRDAMAVDSRGGGTSEPAGRGTRRLSAMAETEFCGIFPAVLSVKGANARGFASCFSICGRWPPRKRWRRGRGQVTRRSRFDAFGQI